MTFVEYFSRLDISTGTRALFLLGAGSVFLGGGALFIVFALVDMVSRLFRRRGGK